MSHIYRLSRAGIKLLYKIRHHKGHGIHSPFVFGFINRVIEEKTAYYAYNEIKSYLNKFPDVKQPEDKVSQLYFKVVNYFNPQNILELGSGTGVNSLYISAVSAGCNCTCVEQDPNKYKVAKEIYQDWERNITFSPQIPFNISHPFDCIFINLKNYKDSIETIKEFLLSNVNSNGFVFVDGIRTNKTQQMLWKMLIQDQRVTISMDLFEIGILFFNTKYIKRNYKLSF